MTIKSIRILSLAALVAMFASLAGCNTVKGAGKDIEATGEAVQDVAEDAKD